MNDYLIWVDEDDREIGYGEKMATHHTGQLHRAFSVFIYDSADISMLIQKRAAIKYHSGGLWSNACCSHPYKGENWRRALERCITTELGIRPVLESPYIANTPTQDDLDAVCQGKMVFSAGAFNYFSDYGAITEHEIDHVFLYLPDNASLSTLKTDPLEVSEIRWVSQKDLTARLTDHPEEFTSWFPEAYNLAAIALNRVISPER